ncbi:MAG: hypothetical protein H7175_06310, partial [Burkholderiales bacterium]|nr:hypothetical protein [Anaerolineae bacterium]
WVLNTNLQTTNAYECQAIPLPTPTLVPTALVETFGTVKDTATLIFTPTLVPTRP